MLAACPGVLSLFHEEGLWEVMFSEYFFYFEMSSDIAMDGRRLSDVQVLYSSGIFDYGDHEEIIDSEPLRLEVISFVELAATANNSNDNLVNIRIHMVPSAISRFKVRCIDMHGNFSCWVCLEYLTSRESCLHFYACRHHLSIFICDVFFRLIIAFFIE